MSDDTESALNQAVGDLADVRVRNAQLEMQLAAQLDLVGRLRIGLHCTIEGMEDMLTYVPPFLRQQWEHDSCLTDAKRLLGEEPDR